MANTNFITRVLHKVKDKAILSLTKREVINYKNQGFINFIDVGAIGKIPSPWLEHSNQIGKLLRFEPRENAITFPDVITMNCALSSKNETRPFYINKGNQAHGSSLFPQNFEYIDEHFEEIKHRGPTEYANTWHERSQLDKIIQLECKSLDNVLKELSLDPFDFIKIDAQGAEYEILLGSEHFLKNHCLGLQLELFEIPVYKDIGLKSEVIDYLKQMGFQLVKEFPPHGTFDASNDCLFLKQQTTPENSKKIQFIKKIYNI